MSLAVLRDAVLASTPPAATHPTVIATRVCVSRNLDEAFTASLDAEERGLLRRRLLDGLEACPTLVHDQVYALETLEPHERDFLAEAILDPAVAQEGGPPLGLVFGADPRLSVLVGGEDHLRIQCLRLGFAPEKAYGCVDSVDEDLEERFEFAFSEAFGYLTSSPRLTGTGLRASAIVHLPALALSDELPKIFRGLGVLHLSVRDAGGGELTGRSALLEIANSRSLGQPESALLQLLKGTVAKLDEFESLARERLLAEARSLLEDRVWSAYGQLERGRVMDGERARSLLSDLRLGCLTGIIENVSLQEVQDIWLKVRSGSLQAVDGPLAEGDRNALRAQRLRDWLGAGAAPASERKG